MSFLLAELATADEIVRAAKAMRARGVTRFDAFTPYPLPELEDALGLSRSKIPKYAFAAAVIGGASAYGLQYWLNGILYPLNVGARPLHSAPTNLPITFETAVLFAALTAFVGVLVACRLPKPWHPVFEIEGFERASIDRYFLAIAYSPELDLAETTRLLLELGALRVIEHFDLENERGWR